MYAISQLREFAVWLNGLKDGLTHRRLGRRLEKAQGGNLGDGDKSAPAADIAKAIKLAATLED